MCINAILSCLEDRWFDDFFWSRIFSSSKIENQLQTYLEGIPEQ